MDSFITKAHADRMHGGARIVIVNQCTCDCPPDTGRCPTVYTCPIEICDPPQSELYCHQLGVNQQAGVNKIS